MIDHSEISELLDSGNEIAIIGMAGYFPGARTIDEFWNNLKNGVESISSFTPQQLKRSSLNPTIANRANHVKAGAVLDAVDQFDASFFGINPRDAEIMDPQHRLFLECAWSALESAGYNPTKYDGAIGVYAGENMSGYLLNLYSNPEIMESVDELQLGIGNSSNHLTTFVSYKLNLKGPSINVQTACSTSLVAVHLACQNLLNHECDMALAGGVSLALPQESGYLYQRGGILSPDGHCRAFDAKAQGSVPGNGVGIVVLKRLADALEDGDYIQAVIKGSAINNDGSLKVGYTAPSVQGQTQVIVEALAVAGVEPKTVSYVEAHGSATELGDSIEIAALTQAFHDTTQARTLCAIGSVKTNIGHLNTAAGVAGLIKTVLALKHKFLPPSLHFEQPNPRIDFRNSPFYVNSEPGEWTAGATPRRAGVSSFGLGGTNAHVIVEEAPAVKTNEITRPWQLLMLSARTDSALEVMTANLAEHLRQNPSLNMADVAYTLHVGRMTFNHQRILVCQGIDDAVASLTDATRSKTVVTGYQERRNRPVAFMFSGLGDHYVNMALELYEGEPTFRQHVDYCCDYLKPHLGIDLREILYPKSEKNSEVNQPQNGLDLRTMLRMGNGKSSEMNESLNQTSIIQPALFVVEYALAQLWIEWGVVPQAMIGYSLGEYVAACLAGVFSLEDALLLVAKRAQMIQTLSQGAMLAVPMSEEEVYSLLSQETDQETNQEIDQKLSLSAINGPSLCVISGTTDAITSLANQFNERGIACRSLQTSHAFHSTLMEPIRRSFVELVSTVPLNPPKIPYLSNVTGTWITDSDATDPEYWARHLCQPVRFSEGIQQLQQDPEFVLLEIGPGQTLSSLAMLHAASHTNNNTASNDTAEPIALPSLRPMYLRQSDLAFLLTTAGKLSIAGVQIDWSKYYANESRHRVPLPTYPFERQRYWVELKNQDTVISTSQARSEEKLNGLEPPNPETLNGKDKALHSEVMQSRMPMAKSYVAPTNDIERTIADLWSKLLGIKEIGIRDSFWEIGGHSLLAVQFLNKVWERYHVEIPLRSVYEHPTVAELAQVIEQTRNQKPDSSDQETPIKELVLTQSPTNRLELLEEYLGGKVSQSLGIGIEQIAIDRDLKEVGLEKITPDLMMHFKRDFQLTVYPIEIMEKASIHELAKFIATELDRTNNSVNFVPQQLNQISEESDEESDEELDNKVENVVFLLSAPRSGSTLLRVMLAGHPNLFCPPELHLLLHETMVERSQKQLSPDRDQGLQRTFMELLNLDSDRSRLFVEELTRKNTSVQDVYRLIQQLTSPRLFVDKAPGYARDIKTLERAEKSFKNPKYIYLIRHPFAVIESSVRNRFDKLIGVGDVDPYLFAEFNWEKHNSNILDFLENVDPNRHHLVRYEELVSQPAKVMEQVCAFLGLPFDDAVLHPYDGKRMTDGLGDPNFLTHNTIESALGDVWRSIKLPRRLGRYARRLATELNYELPGDVKTPMTPLGTHVSPVSSTSPQVSVAEPLFQPFNQSNTNYLRDTLVAIQPHGHNVPLFCVHPIVGTVSCYADLAVHLGSDQPLYGLQALGLTEGVNPHRYIEDMASHYIAALKLVQPHGPYRIGGWSFGGRVAFEMAQQLQAQGEAVSMLALIDTDAPSISSQSMNSQSMNSQSMNSQSVSSQEISELDDAEFLVKQFGEDLFSLAHLRQLAPEEQLNYAIEQLQRFDIISPKFERSQARRLLQVYRTNLQARQQYKPRSYSGRVLLLRASERPVQDSASSWDTFVSEGADIHWIPGNHKTILAKPNVAILAARLKEYL